VAANGRLHLMDARRIPAPAEHGERTQRLSYG